MVLVTTDLYPGGAQKVCVNLSKTHKVNLVILRKNLKLLNKINSNINIIHFNFKKLNYSFFKLFLIYILIKITNISILYIFEFDYIIKIKHYNKLRIRLKPYKYHERLSQIKKVRR